MLKKLLSIILPLALLVTALPTTLLPQAALAAGTTTITVTKLASNGTTVLDEVTKTPDELKAMTVYGDGVTEYYHQGPTFQPANMWDVEESIATSIDSRNYGAAKGTDVRDLLALVGGAPAGSEIEIKAVDNFTKTFIADDFYAMTTVTPIVAWNNVTYGGDVPAYDTGMRLIFLDSTTNAAGQHVFGNWDMHETLQEASWHYFADGATLYPSSSGLSVSNVNRIFIHTDVDVLFDGVVDLTPDETFDVTAYVLNPEGTTYSVSRTTPLGALDKASTTAATPFTYVMSDKNYAGALLLNDIGTYVYQKTPKKAWYAYVNDVYKDGYLVPADGLNVIQLNHGDTVEFYYVDGTVADATNLAAVVAAASAAVLIEASTIAPMDILFDGIVDLTPDETFDVTAYVLNPEGTTYSVSRTTPLGALDKASTTAATPFTYVMSDKNYAGALLLNDIGTYVYQKTPKKAWYAYVNDVYKDGYLVPADGLNVIQLNHGDTVEFYYVDGTVADATNLAAVVAAASAAVLIEAHTGVAPTDWTLQLSGARDESVTKAYFEDGLACASSGHYVEWTDADSNVWGGVPLWLLVGMVDDNPDVGPNHFNFNEALAAQGYSVNVIAGDDWSTTLASADIAMNDGYIVANTLNGEPLPLLTDGGKGCWPLHLKGSAVFGGQQVGNIVRIELTGLPEPPVGWTLEMLGQVGDFISQAEFEDGLACPTSGHYVEWTDADQNIWSGVPLWVLLGAVDDINGTAHWTFNDDVAATGYTVNVIAGDGYTRTFNSADVARSGNYIVANKLNGAELDETSFPLRLVGAGVANTGVLTGAAVGNIVKIAIPELITPAPAVGSWNLALNGKITDVLSQAEFEAGLACPTSGHYQTWTDADQNVWSGIPLWLLAGWVDDRLPHDFNTNQATAGYSIVVKAGDGYAKTFASADVAWSNGYIVANMLNGAPLGDSWPLRLVGANALGGNSVGNIVEIELIDFSNTLPVPQLHIVKYGEDRVTVIDEITIDYVWMQENLDVIGDGTTVYKYEGITNNTEDIWDAGETYPGGFKIQNAVKGSRVSDLCDLVGGMGAGTEVILQAEDGYQTTLPYASIYADPWVYERQGDAILAWWGDGEYVPYYADGMRLFFLPEDTVYGQWDMHESLAENYWHYYYDGSTQTMYPSCAGLSSKYITEIKVYSISEGDWTLALDGQDVGGLYQEVSKTYFEQALACQFGANHDATYTDLDGAVWRGMPLWFLAGFVDDEDQHSSASFNDAMAQIGYSVVITDSNGYSVTINSRDIIRNSNFIVANTRDGVNLPDSDENWPLVLVGPGVSGELAITNIVSIELLPATVTAGGPTSVSLDSAFNIPLEISTVTALDSSNYTITFDPAVLQFTGASAGDIGATAIPVELWNEVAPGTVNVVQNITGLDGASGAGTLAVLHFQAIGSTNQESDITISNGILGNTNAQEIPAQWIGSHVIIGALAGDATGDGVINALDITKVERIIATLDAATPGADANNDGFINALDITTVERLIVGLDP